MKSKALDPIWQYYDRAETFYGTDRSHHEAWCHACLEPFLEEVTEEERQRVLSGESDMMRPDDELREIGEYPSMSKGRHILIHAMLARAKMGSSRGEVKLMYIHLAEDCSLVAPDVQEWAKGREAERLLASKAGQSALKRSASTMFASEKENGLDERDITPPPGPSTDIRPLQDLPHHNLPPRKRSRTVTGIVPLPIHEQVPLAHDHSQAAFDRDLLRLFVVLNWSWNAANHPEFHRFMKKWIPTVTVPDRRTLSGRLLDEEAARIEVNIKEQVKGRYATGQCDGARSRAKDAIQTTTITVENKVSLSGSQSRIIDPEWNPQPYLIDAHVMTDENKDSDTLLRYIMQDITMMISTFAVLLVAWCTDNGPDARGMRRKLGLQFPFLILLECWAHQVSTHCSAYSPVSNIFIGTQINLVVSDYFKLGLVYTEAVRKALDVITWFNNHSKCLKLLRQEMRLNPLGILVLILPIITRWTAHYLAVERLLTVGISIRTCFLRHGEALIEGAGTKPEQKADAQAIKAIVGDDTFWDTLLE